MIFKDKEIQSFYTENGYAVIPLINENIGNCIINIISDVKEQIKSPFFISVELSPKEFRIDLQSKLSEIIKNDTDLYSYINSNFKIFSSSFIAQQAEKRSGFELHTDWSFFDQIENNPVFIWIPLQDTCINSNTTMVIVPKSQKISIPYRGEGIIEEYINKISSEFKHKLKYLNLKKGEAVFFNPAIIHGLLPNNSNIENFSLLCTVCEEDASIIYCKQSKYNIFNSINVYKINEIDDYYYVKTGKKKINTLSLYKKVKKQKTKYTWNEINNIL